MKAPTLDRFEADLTLTALDTARSLMAQRVAKINRMTKPTMNDLNEAVRTAAHLRVVADLYARIGAAHNLRGY